MCVPAHIRPSARGGGSSRSLSRACPHTSPTSSLRSPISSHTRSVCPDRPPTTPLRCAHLARGHIPLRHKPSAARFTRAALKRNGSRYAVIGDETRKYRATAVVSLRAEDGRPAAWLQQRPSDGAEQHHTDRLGDLEPSPRGHTDLPLPVLFNVKRLRSRARGHGH
eukprot:4695971-Prymnesium_polylepis.1